MLCLPTLRCALCLVVLLPPGPAAAALQAPWKLVRDTEAVQVWSRPAAGSPLCELKAQRLVPAAVERVWEVLADTRHAPEFLPHVAEARLWDGAAGRFEYYRVTPPLVQARDYTVRVEQEQRGDTWVRRWHVAAHAAAPAPRPDTIRLATCDGSWTLERLGAECTLLTYWLHTDPGGALPAWVTAMANRRSVPQLLEAVSRRSVEPGWRP